MMLKHLLFLLVLLVMVGESAAYELATPGTFKLNSILDPDGNTSFSLGASSVSWTFSNPASNGFIISVLGAYSGHALHVHQETGNPGATVLAHFEADDPDVLPLQVVTNGTRATVATFRGARVDVDSLNADGEVHTGALDVTGNITVSGTVDGVDVAALNTGVATDSVDWNDAHDHSVNNSQAHTDYMQNIGDVVTGVYDFGGATSLEIPNGVDPAVTVEGHWAWDNNDDAGVVYSGDEGEKVFMPIYHHIVLPLVLPDSIQVYVPNLFLPKFNDLMYPHGVEIDLITLQTGTTNSTISVVVEEWSGADPPVFQNIVTTISTSGDTYVQEAPDTDGNLDANDRLVIDLPAGTGLADYTIEIFFHVTAGN